MTVDDVNAEVERIRAMAGDYETAHGAEDMLHQAVLKAIAQGDCDDPVECARVALTTEEIEFDRLCA